MSHSLEIKINEVMNSRVGPGMLEHDEKWEEKVSFIPNRIWDKQQVEFLLYRLHQNRVYRGVYLWVDVTERDGRSQYILNIT